MKNKRLPLEPIAGLARVSQVEAAELLGVSISTMVKLTKREIFTVIAMHGRGQGKPISYIRKEIEKYRDTRDPNQVAKVQQKHGLNAQDIQGKGVICGNGKEKKHRKDGGGGSG